ncbi:MAG: S4 domain-containing protein, partial [Phycisphaeraceae bacterium]
ITSLINPQVTHPREAKDILAQVIVEEFYDRNAAYAASKEFRHQFTERQLPSDIETKRVDARRVDMVALLRGVGFAKTNSEARRLIVQGGVSFNNRKITDPNATVEIDGEPVLKVGKRRVCKVSVAETDES